MLESQPLKQTSQDDDEPLTSITSQEYQVVHGNNLDDQSSELLHSRPRLSRNMYSGRASLDSNISAVSGNGSLTTSNRRYIYSGIALLLALVSFVVQTEAAGYVATRLGYRKPIFSLYLTHCSWTLLWPLQVAFIYIYRRRKLARRGIPFRVFVRRHLRTVANTASLVAYGRSDWLRYLLVKCLVITVALNIAGCSWYIAVNITTPADVTAIYNCSAFFAYAFSVMLLGERFSWYKTASVFMSLLGVLAIAYGGVSDEASSSSPSTNTSSGGSATDSPTYPYRFAGNLVIGFGAILYGLYEVLYKMYLCPKPNMQVSSRREALLANVMGSVLGASTMLWLWPVLVILHFTGIEPFELPSPQVALYLLISVFSNMVFSGSFLVLMALTSPVLSSVAALVTTFAVAIVDWMLFGTRISVAGFFGGILIIIAFAMLAHATWQELSTDVEDDDDDE